MGSYQNESLISTRGFQTEQTFWRVFNKNLSSYKSFGQLFGEGLDETLVIDRAVSSPGTADWKNRSLPTFLLAPSPNPHQLQKSVDPNMLSFSLFLKHKRL